VSQNKPIKQAPALKTEAVCGTLHSFEFSAAWHTTRNSSDGKWLRAHVMQLNCFPYFRKQRTIRHVSCLFLPSAPSWVAPEIADMAFVSEDKPDGPLRKQSAPLPRPATLSPL
jgi:hypothetical protein